MQWNKKNMKKRLEEDKPEMRKVRETTKKEERA
jgi:hypothetical protein